jgi:LmbE family N-acetylglucosaminyl deacetylase
VTAHPDDVDFGAAGTVATWVAAGVEVAYCICTDGDAGGSDRTISRAEVAALRQEEQRAAAAKVGVTDVTFLGHPDGRLAPTIELRRDISRVIRQFRPELVLMQSPERDWGRLVASHPDHLAAGEAAVDSVYPDARNPFAHPELLAEGLEPHTVLEIWVMASPRTEPLIAVDITAQFDRKMEALRSHASQGTGDPAIEELVRGWAAAQAAMVGLPDGSLAETFQVARIPF